MKYYAANNTYASETSFGFSSTWYVLAFSSKVTRDNYVNNSNSLAARKIKRKDIGEYIDKPKPFSGKRWRILNTDAPIPGLLGEIITDWSDGGLGEPLNS